MPRRNTPPPEQPDDSGLHDPFAESFTGSQPRVALPPPADEPEGVEPEPLIPEAQPEAAPEPDVERIPASQVTPPLPDGGYTFEMTDLSALQQDPNNLRRHNERNMGMIVDSLQEVGAARSIVVDENGVILAGNGTAEAAAQAGITRVLKVKVDGNTLVAVERDNLDDDQKARLAIYDNRATDLSDFDPAALLAMQEEHPDVLTGIFYENELSELALTAMQQAADEAVDGLDLPTEEAGTARPTNGNSQSGNRVIAYNMVFDDEGQQERFHGFLRWLREEYPDADTVAERFDLFVTMYTNRISQRESERELE